MRYVEDKVKYSWRDIGVFFIDCVVPPRHICFSAANYARLVELSLGVTTGHPVWKMWQSRVLGPYIIKALTFGSLDYVQSAYLVSNRNGRYSRLPVLASG